MSELAQETTVLIIVASAIAALALLLVLWACWRRWSGGGVERYEHAQVLTVPRLTADYRVPVYSPSSAGGRPEPVLLPRYPEANYAPRP